MFISTIAIRRPVFTTMFILSMVVFGIVSLRGLGVDLFPKVDFPIVSIVTRLPGADPETVEKQISDPLEEAINTLAAIKTLRSTSAEGYSLITVEFQLEKNIDVAFQEVQARVNTVRSQLPTDTKDPVIEKFDVDSAPIMTLVISGDLSDRDMYDLADKQIKERLQRVRDVGSIKIVGGRQRKLWLWLDADRMKQHSLTVQAIRAALLSQHVEIPGGRVENGKTELVTRTKAEFQDAAQINEMPILRPDGTTIRLKDVGKTEDGLEEQRSYAQRGDRPGIALQIRRQSGTNTVQVAHDLKAEIAKISKELASRGVQLDITVDLSTYIERSLTEVNHHLVIGGMLAVVTVLIFLLNFRSTFISAMVLPTSILATFMLMSAMGFTLNMMTLMALTLAIGLLIDDAIVVQENIMRHVQEGMPASFAAEFATKEIGLAVLATTLSVVAVFLPTAFTKGIVGRFFFPFGLTISFAVMISMFVSFTLDPMLSSRMLRKTDKHNAVFRGMEAAFHAAERGYKVMLGWALSHRLIVIVLAVGMFVASLKLGGFIQTEFQPVEDRGEFEVLLKAPLGASLQTTRGLLETIRKKMENIPEVAYTFYSIGGGDLGKVNEGTVYVRLAAKEQRQAAGRRGQVDTMEEARRLLKGQVPGARTSVQQVNAIAGGAGGWRSTVIQYELCGPDLRELERIAAVHLEKMRADKAYMDIDTTYEPGRPETSVVVNREKASDLGVTPLDIADTVRCAIGGVDVAKFRSGRDRYDIAVRFLEGARNDSERILDLLVPSAKGAPVELRRVAHVLPSSVPVEINRYNRQRSITVLANLQKERKLGDAIEQFKGFTEAAKLPSGYTGTWVGQAEIMGESFANLGFTFVLSVLVIYMVLAAQFESLVHPFTIMLTLPLALVGAVLSLLAFGQTINIMTIMAFIFLGGLVTKNAILLIDYANKLRDRDGMERDEALRHAGPVRLRPILMTTMAMIFGMLPSALGTGSGAETRQPMGIAIIGGLITSTLLTLLVIPVVYSVLDPLSEWMRRKVLTPRDGYAPPREEPRDETPSP
ncbi:MAG: efflux RND transporter permease subunit [Planctomycetota bacterium]|nr:efflux RND transporter permease subunit [Planctomycetota bacterium]